MANVGKILLDKLIISAHEYKVVLFFNNTPYPLFTVAGFETNIQCETETFYRAGDEKPIAEKRNNKSYSGKLTVQAGELSMALKVFGLNDTTQIVDATLSICDTFGRVARAYLGFNINTELLSITANDKKTLISCDWKAVDLIGI